MLLYSQKYSADFPAPINPTDEIAGFEVRPGLFDVNGAMALASGVNFTVHTREGTGCEPVSYTHLDVYKRQAVLQ